MVKGIKHIVPSAVFDQFLVDFLVIEFDHTSRMSACPTIRRFLVYGPDLRILQHNFMTIVNRFNGDAAPIFGQTTVEVDQHHCYNDNWRYSCTHAVSPMKMCCFILAIC
jgi:hypothetical protein